MSDTNKRCESHTEYGRHLSDSLCPYAENEMPPMQPLEALDRIIGAAQEETVSLAEMAAHEDPLSRDEGYQKNLDSLAKALESEGDLRRLIAAAPELLAATKALLADADDREETHDKETGEEYADYKALRQAIAKAEGHPNE
jgi:hypothetical protein